MDVFSNRGRIFLLLLLFPHQTLGSVRLSRPMKAGFYFFNKEITWLPKQHCINEACSDLLQVADV